MRETMLHWGLQVDAYAQPEAALTAFEAAPDTYDVVVTDLAMPHLSGVELAARLRERGRLPVVLVSGYVRRTQPERGARNWGCRAPRASRSEADLLRPPSKRRSRTVPSPERQFAARRRIIGRSQRRQAPAASRSSRPPESIAAMKLARFARIRITMHPRRWNRCAAEHCSWAEPVIKRDDCPGLATAATRRASSST